jgi:ketosteroid isomerase-like protein
MKVLSTTAGSALALLTFLPSALAFPHQLSTRTTVKESILEAQLAIQGVQNRIAHAIDDKNFQSFSDLLTVDAVYQIPAANFSVSGADKIRSAIEASVRNFQTQHMINTEVFDIDIGAGTAEVVAYLDQTNKAPGEVTRQAKGKYLDKYIYSCCDAQGRGKWQLSSRIVQLQVCCPSKVSCLFW